MELREFIKLIDDFQSYAVAWYSVNGDENIIFRSWEDDIIPEDYEDQEVEGIWFDRNQDSLMVMIFGEDD